MEGPIKNAVNNITPTAVNVPPKSRANHVVALPKRMNHNTSLYDTASGMITSIAIEDMENRSQQNEFIYSITDGSVETQGIILFSYWKI